MTAWCWSHSCLSTVKQDFCLNAAFTSKVSLRSRWNLTLGRKHGCLKKVWLLNCKKFNSNFMPTKNLIPHTAIITSSENPDANAYWTITHEMMDYDVNKQNGAQKLYPHFRHSEHSEFENHSINLQQVRACFECTKTSSILILLVTFSKESYFMANLHFILTALSK